MQSENKSDVRTLFQEFLKTKPTIEEFQAKAKTYGFTQVRVSTVNGQSKALTMDYRDSRIYVEVDAPVKTWDVKQVGKTEIREAVVDMDAAVVTDVDFIG